MTTEHHAGWVRALDETATLRAENERLTRELELVNDTLVQRTKAMHRALAEVDACRALANEWASDPVGGDLWRSEAIDGLRAALGEEL